MILLINYAVSIGSANGGAVGGAKMQYHGGGFQSVRLGTERLDQNNSATGNPLIPLVEGGNHQNN
jgi:hypothetical protein